jgi:putative flippase GtrA
MRHHLPRLARYAAVSVVSTITTMIVLGALVAGRLTSPAIANVVATAVATVPSFELNRAWVWKKRGKRSMGREVAAFWAMSFAGLVLSTITVAFAVHHAESSGLSTLGRTIAAQVANLAAWGSLWLGQYAVLDRFMFGGHTHPAIAAED